ncbi:ABC transporter substrate-binding protein [Brevibacterium album]|uniref:ABC transporter substrate-binding protein n=1 Tax=Brevibacterium album TaxID=417948 RepID=UPI0003F6A68E|nr:ABC transporter substrate-binding protein [Brevibacterium album]
MTSSPIHRKLLAAGVALGLAGLAACGADESAGGDGQTFVFASSRLPTTLDGAYIYDNESQRVIYQIFDRLTNVEPGTSELTGELATDWDVSDDGLRHTFNLREGVKFHDGTDLDAEAVCFNFDRLYELEGQAQTLAEYWKIAFKGFKEDAEGNSGDSRYESCEVVDPTTLTIHINEPYAPLPAAVANIGFGIASPAALQESGWAVEASGDSLDFVGKFGTENPVGSGPFKFESWDPGKNVTLVKNEEYWGDPATIDTLIYVPIDDGQARRQALERGEIDGYDNVAPQDVEALTSAGYAMEERPPSNTGYLAMNRDFEPLDDVEVRRAVSHAINRDALLQANFLEGAVKPTGLLPPGFTGSDGDVPQYEYDQEKARELLSGADAEDLKVEITYATEVTRPYMPDPQGIAETFKSDLEAVGFEVTLVGRPWSPDFLGGIRNGESMMYIVGLLPDMSDPANFMTLMNAGPGRWGTMPDELLDQITAAETAPPEEREELYRALNAAVMEDAPMVPYVHAPTHLAFREGTSGFVPSPLFAESMATVEMSD